MGEVFGNIQTRRVSKWKVHTQPNFALMLNIYNMIIVFQILWLSFKLLSFVLNIGKLRCVLLLLHLQNPSIWRNNFSPDFLAKDNSQKKMECL